MQKASLWLTISQPLVAVQTKLAPSQVAIGQTLVIFQQFFGGSLFLAIAQTLFNSSLGDALRKFAPNVDAQSVIHAGASGVYSVVAARDIPAVLRAYNAAVQHEFYLGAGCSSVIVFTCLGMGWKKVTASKSDKTTESSDQEDKSQGEEDKMKEKV